MKNNYTIKSILAFGALLLSAASIAQTTTFSYTGSVETYVVPAGVTSIEIIAEGAEGGTNTGGTGGAYGEPGLGASMQGNFAVTPGQVLSIIVGEQPAGGNFVGGGGGGSFVWDDGTGTLLIAAGGGGGAGYSANQDGIDAVTTMDGTNGNNVPDGAGTAGNGGTAPSDPDIASGGAGWLSNGSNGTVYGFCTSNSTGGQTPLSGGAGGSGGGDGIYIGPGGFGGGGGGNARCGAVGGGGGGGYSGGGAGGEPVSGYQGGGGGGSYNDGTDQVNTAGVGTGHGEVSITVLCSGLTYTVSDDTVCVGDEVTLDATSTLGGTITWDGGVTNGTPFTPPAGTTTYTATSSDPGDCLLMVTIFVGELPTVDAGTDIMFCTGDEVTLTATGTATDWAWDGGITDGVPFSPSGDNTYTLTGTIDSTGCMATDDVAVNEVIIDNSISVISGGSLMANQAGATYQWLECPAFTPVAGETSQTYASVPEGDFAVEITLDGCVDTSACQVVHVGISEFEKSIELYPNPTNGEFWVTTNGTFNYTVTNVVGEVIYEGTATDKKQFDLSQQASGAYFVKLTQGAAVYTEKVIKK